MMQKTWQAICEIINTADAKLEEFMLSAGLSTLQINKLNKFIKEWNNLKKSADSFDQFLTPVSPIEVEYPFEQDDFKYTWKIWKEYLREQHGIYIRSRAEQQSLLYLNEISEGNADKAVCYLRYAMAFTYRFFFKVEKKDTVNPPNNNNNDSDF
ncbi:MAG: hypothetical protein FWF54_03330 [Candidatus Azobacteroides sp.]|nr:hypothetical protein [Candidatus Azobacteroides sp.]